jgi:hypothetical protein
MADDAYHRDRRDPHDVLGVPRGAGKQEIVRAFHRKVRSGGHPDTGGDAQTFHEMIRARDELLGQARPTRHKPYAQPAAAPSPAPPQAPSASPARPAEDPPRETSKLAIAAVILAFLGPLFWPVAIVVGHLAQLHIKRTGKGGRTLVPILLLILYVVTILVLIRILSVALIP